MKRYVDLNSDLGESFGVYRIGQDEAVMKYITSANIAAGYHAGDHNVLRRSVQLAADHNIGIGAHPGYQDLQGFGRRNLHLDPEEIYNLVVYQIGAVAAFAKLYNRKLNHVKPHGALYNLASQDSEVANGIAKAVHDVDPDLILFALSGGELLKAGKNAGLQVASEVFADRTYQPDGTLTPRTEKGAMISDVQLAVERVMRMVAEGTVEATDGSVIPIQADTICVHGDTADALGFVVNLKKGLENNGISIRRVGT